MRKISRSTLLVEFIVSCVLGIISVIVIFFTGGLNSYVGGVGIFMVIFALIVLPFEFWGMILNWKKVLKGIIAPIPILSMVIESFKGMIYAVKGFLVIIKKEEYLAIGKPEENDGIHG